MNFICFGLYRPVCTYINKSRFFEILVFRRNFKAVCKLYEVGFVKPKLPQPCLLHREGSYKCLDAKFKTSAIFFPKQFLANFLRTKSMGTKAPMPHPHNIFQVLLHAVTLVPFRKKTVLCDTENRRKPNESYVEHRKLQT